MRSTILVAIVLPLLVPPMGRTAPAPFLVKNIDGGPASSFFTDADRLGPSLAGALFFTARDGDQGTALWKSDGTAEGTVPLKDVFPTQLTIVNGTLFFQGYEPDHGTELWKSDGTGAGTVLCADVIPGPASGFPGPLAGVGGRLFFSAEDGVHGRELWVTDGSSAGTSLVKDIDPRAPGFLDEGSSFPFDLTDVNGTLFFTANDGVHGRELWRSDGTQAGTFLVRDIASGLADGVPSFPGFLVDLGGTLFFRANEGPGATALYKSDGTESGTIPIKPFPSDMKDLIAVGSRLFFLAFDPTRGWQPWVSDGTTDGTIQLTDLGTGPGIPGFLTGVGSTLFFKGRLQDLWKSDGTPAGTILLKRFGTDSGKPEPFDLVSVGDQLFFSADDGVTGIELWTSDGTSAGTVLVEDIHPGPEASFASGGVDFDGTLLFIADDGTTGRELWAFLASCGDGVANPAEECDDGNVADGDGCSRSCTIETAATSTSTTFTATTSTTTTTVVSNRVPDCGAAAPSIAKLWPPSHEFVPIQVKGVTDPDGDPVEIVVDDVTQDEAIIGRGDGHTCRDATGVGTSTANVRAERSGRGDGRVYHIGFTGRDGRGGECTGVITVCVPHDQGARSDCHDQGRLHDATENVCH